MLRTGLRLSAGIETAELIRGLQEVSADTEIELAVLEIETDRFGFERVRRGDLSRLAGKDAAND